MKYFCTLVLMILLASKIYAQNVGIGEANPTESKLQIKTADSAALLIQNTATPIGTKTGLFFKSDGNFSGSIATIKTAPVTYRLGMFTFGGPNATSLQERVSITDDGNVGIGNTNPSAKLEVSGTVKIVNGTQGENKVLTSDAAGNANWQSLKSNSNYKYCKQVLTTGAGSFTIPAGVTEIMVEVWGAGSGGITTSSSVSIVNHGWYLGGSSGGYASTTQNVVPGYNLTYAVGIGGADGAFNTNLTDGGSTTVNFASGNLVALGAKGHIANSYEVAATQSGTSTLSNFYVLSGNSGGYPSFKSEQTSSTDFWKIVTAGDGGKPVGLANTSFQKGAHIYFLNGSYLYEHSEYNSSIRLPSSGGASDDFGNGGGHGMILIWYN